MSARVLVPAEPLASAAGTLARAALGPPTRDLATTRRGTVGYAFARHLPRRLLDRLAGAQMRRLARGGHFDGSELSREFGARLGSTGSRGRARS